MSLRIRALREDNDFLQKEIACILSITQTGYSKYETGENSVPLDSLKYLSYFYDVSMEYLVGISDVQDLPEPSPEAAGEYRLYRKMFLDLKASHASGGSV